MGLDPYPFYSLYINKIKSHWNHDEIILIIIGVPLFELHSK